VPRLSVKGFIMNYEAEGIEGKSENIALIHGMGDSSKMWWNQVKPFTKDYRVILYDVKGHGSSDRPKTGYTIPELADDVFELHKLARAQIAGDLESHDDMVSVVKPPVWVGYSMGGRIALEIAIRHPEWLKGLVLANSGIGLNAPSPEALKRREEMMALLQKGDMRKWAEMSTTSAFSPDFRQKNSKAFDQYMKVKLGNKADGLYRVMEGMAASTDKPDLSQLKCPVLIIVGEHDSYMGPEQGKQAQAAIPGSKLVVLPTGHAAAVEAPEQFNAAVLDFVKSLAT